MLNRLSAFVLGSSVLAAEALAQPRPPTSGQTPALSVERAWTWLIARPGVMIAIAVMILAVIWIVVSRTKSKT